MTQTSNQIVGLWGIPPTDNQITFYLGVDELFQYVEYVATYSQELGGRVYIVRPDEPVPQIKDYGLRVYLGEANWVTTTREKIGPILTKRFRINVDLVFNKSYRYREMFSAKLGVSFWERTIEKLFANKTANGLFRDSIWTSNGQMEQNAESIILKGILTVVTDTVVRNT